MKKSPHIIWVCPSSQMFYRSKGEVRPKPGSVIPKLIEQGVKLDVLIPYNPTLLPKTKLSSARVTRHKIQLSDPYAVDIIKLTRGANWPGVYMANIGALTSPALSNALFAKAALALAHQLKRPVDIFHLFGWETAMLPLFLELERNGNRLFKTTRTFFHINSMNEQGNFSPAILDELRIPAGLFHPEGIEFYGKVNFLKTGLLFSDRIAVVEGRRPVKLRQKRNVADLEGVLAAQAGKVRKWASERSVRHHMDMYAELLNGITPGVGPMLLARAEKAAKTKENPVDKFVETWGPLPPERYHVSSLSFVLQSPKKAFAFWEWSSSAFPSYGLVLDNRSRNLRKILSRSLGPCAEYWIDVEPDQEYVLEFVAFDQHGHMRPLLRSRLLRTPRVGPSGNRQAVFINVKTGQRTLRRGPGLMDDWTLRVGGTSAMEWSAMPSSFPANVSSR